jgi:drug/metabolite transporter (DMT)-like permease
MCAVRFAIAGVIMLAVCALTGRRIWYSPRQIALVSVVGILLLMGGNLTLSYAELSVSTGLAALIIAITPLWFLIVCGSWIGYTAYIWLLEHVPTSKVSTYAYVNPVVAVFLGWLVLHERVSGFILAGSAVVVLSVILVTSAKVSEQVPALEAAGD